MIRTIYKCPNCSKALKQGMKQYFCPNGHSFDIARKGYVNLLLSSHIGAGNPGDTKEMLQSRREFLDKGYYEEFSDTLNTLTDRFCFSAEKLRYSLSKENAEINIYDAGCGEGYYISRLKNAQTGSGISKQIDSAEIAHMKYTSDLSVNFYGTDVSKDAINYAAGRDRDIRFAVASNYHIPLLGNSVDCILCIFAPRDEKEFRRVLKPEGKLIVAVPGARHLYSLKKLIYKDPEEIGLKGTVQQGFKLIDETNVHYDIYLKDKPDIQNLFKMTPYSRHADVVALGNMEELVTEVDINILTYERI